MPPAETIRTAARPREPVRPSPRAPASLRACAPRARARSAQADSVALVAHHAAERRRQRVAAAASPAQPLRRRAHAASRLPDVQIDQHADGDAGRRAAAATIASSPPMNRRRPSSVPARASAATRSHFPARRPRWRSAHRRRTPPPTSASDTVAQVRPTHDPAASWRRAISGVLCALKCGRSRQAPVAKNVRHAPDVPVERGDVDDERRCRDLANV